MCTYRGGTSVPDEGVPDQSQQNDEGPEEGWPCLPIQLRIDRGEFRLLRYRRPDLEKHQWRRDDQQDTHDARHACHQDKGDRVSGGGDKPALHADLTDLPSVRREKDEHAACGGRHGGSQHGEQYEADSLQPVHVALGEGGDVVAGKFSTQELAR